MLTTKWNWNETVSKQFQFVVRTVLGRLLQVLTTRSEKSVAQHLVEKIHF